MARLLAFPGLGRGLASRACEGGSDYRASPSHGPAPLTPADWLEARFPTEDRVEQARGLQAALGRIAAAQAQLEIAIGAGLEELHGRFDLRELGHSNFDALCTGRLGFSASHGRELRKLSRRLPELPTLRDALLAGLVPRTRVREVLDVATAEDEASWARLAMQLTTRELKRRVREAKAAPSADAEGACASPSGLDEGDDELVRVSWLATGPERATWAFALALLRQLTGRRGPHSELAEALAAEVLSGYGPPDSWLAERPDGAEGCVRSGLSAAQAAAEPAMIDGCRRGRGVPTLKALKRLQRLLARERASNAESAIAAEPEAAFPELPRFEACDTAGEVLDGLLGCVRRLTGIESERARLLSWMQGRALYRELGHPRFHDWLERRLGLSPRDARQLIDLQARLALLPALERAWQSSELTTHQCRRLAEIAAHDTQDDWLRFARSATPKLLDAAVERWRVAERRTSRPLPPWDVPLRRLLLDWQAHFGLRRRRALRAVEGACAPDDRSTEAVSWAEGGACASDLWRVGRIGFSAPPEVARLWREAGEAVRAAAGTVLSDADVVRRMIEHLIEVHVNEEVLARARRHRAIERDGWTCQMPHCRSMGPFHEHHRQFRSAGGSDDVSNLVTLCAPCHAMLHEGHVVILGSAPDELTFLLGTRRERYRGEHVEGQATRGVAARSA